MGVVGGSQSKHREYQHSDDVEGGTGTHHVHEDRHNVPGSGETHEVVVAGLPVLVSVAEHGGYQDQNNQR